MKPLLHALSGVLAAAAVAGCAAPDASTGTAATEKAPKLYRVGSMLPSRDSSEESMTDAEREQLRRSMQEATAAKKPAGGGQ